MIRITGTLIWYYYICKRETWLMAHQITSNQDNELLELGKLLSGESYSREKKEVRVGNVVFDLLKSKKEDIVIGEIKKSSKFIESAKMQVSFYLKKLKDFGVDAKGELLFPKEKKKIVIELDEEIINTLKEAEKNIKKILIEEFPEKPKKIKFCNSCSYSEYCWS